MQELSCVAFESSLAGRRAQVASLLLLSLANQWERRVPHPTASESRGKAAGLPSDRGSPARKPATACHNIIALPGVWLCAPCVAANVDAATGLSGYLTSFASGLLSPPFVTNTLPFAPALLLSYGGRERESLLLLSSASKRMKGGKGKGATKKEASLKLVDDRKLGKRKAAVKPSKNSKRAAKKKKIAKKDPNKPKRPPSAFFVFLEEFRKTYKQEHPNVKSVLVVGKAGGEKWKSMSHAEKAPFEAIAAKKKSEYEKLISAYNKKQESVADDGDEESDRSKSEMNDDEDEENEEEEEEEDDDDDNDE